MHEVVFGAEKLHVHVKQTIRDQKGSTTIGKVFQFGVNHHESKIETQSKRQFDDLITSILDENFFKGHVQVFEDIKL